jgi:hypothetical protein
VLPHEKEKMKQERIEGKEVVLSSVDWWSLEFLTSHTNINI